MESETLNKRYPIWRPDYLCKWCLAYVGQRRQFCSADCAAQFKLCQRRRERRQDLNISVDYYGNVKLSIQGQPLHSGEDITVTKSFPAIGGPRRGRRRKRCRNCAKLLKDESEQDYCDVTCHNMDDERNKREDFVNVFQQKETAERRRIRKWLIDAQDDYTKQQGDGEPYINANDLDDALDITSGPAALNPLPIIRTPINTPVDPIPLPTYTKQTKDMPSKSGGPGGQSYSWRRTHYVPQRFNLRTDEVVTGGPVTLNPIPLRKGQLRPDRHKAIDSDKRQLRIDLKWIPKFYG